MAVDGIFHPVIPAGTAPGSHGRDWRSWNGGGSI